MTDRITGHCVLQEKKKQQRKLVNRLGITKMIEDMKELFATMTGFRQTAQQGKTAEAELLLKVCQSLDTLPDRMRTGSNGRAKPEMKSVECQCDTEPELIPEVVHHEVEEQV